MMNITNFVVLAIKEGILLSHRFMIAETITHACKNEVRSPVEDSSHQYRVFIFTENVVIWTKEINGQERNKCQHKMSRRNNSERGYPPHADRWSSERDRLQQEKNQEYGRPVAVCLLLLSLRCVPDIKQHWRKKRRPDGKNSAQAIDNRQSDKPVFSKHDVFPHVCREQYLNQFATIICNVKAADLDELSV